jgi:hypothetical protein
MKLKMNDYIPFCRDCVCVVPGCSNKSGGRVRIKYEGIDSLVLIVCCKEHKKPVETGEISFCLKEQPDSGSAPDNQSDPQISPYHYKGVVYCSGVAVDGKNNCESCYKWANKSPTQKLCQFLGCKEYACDGSQFCDAPECILRHNANPPPTVPAEAGSSDA